jgi:hypothetical protein
MKFAAGVSGIVLIFLAVPGVARVEGPVIDIHLHVWPEQWFPAPPHGYPAAGLEGAETQDEQIAGTIAEMEKHGVVLGLVSEVPGDMERLVSRDPERFWPFPLFDAPSLRPGAKPLDLDVLEHNLASGEWRGIGELPTQYNGLSPTGELLWPYYALAERREVPIFAHTGLSFPGITRMDPKFRADLGRPLQWEEVLVKHPDLRIVLMHAGWPYLDEMIAIMSTYPNVYVDTGAVVHLISPREFYRFFGVLIDVGFGGRILFGSDQMGWPGAIGYGIEVIEDAPWDEKVKRDVLYNNAARFLGLSDETIAAHHAAVGEK